MEDSVVGQGWQVGQREEPRRTARDWRGVFLAHRQVDEHQWRQQEEPGSTLCPLNFQGGKCQATMQERNPLP